MPDRNVQHAARYERIFKQLDELLNEGPKRTRDPIARMATICALLAGKMPHFFWTGFYRLQDGKLVVTTNDHVLGRNVEIECDLLTLAAAIGTELVIETEGPDEDAAIKAVTALIADRFGEGE